MDNVMIYKVPGSPIPLLRARHSFKTHTIYNSQQTQQLVARINLQEQHGNRPLFKGPVHIDIVFYMPIPKYNTKNKTHPRQLA